MGPSICPFRTIIGQLGGCCRAFISTGSTGSIESVDFWKRHNGTCEIAKIIRIESVNFQDIITLEPVISKTLRQPLSMNDVTSKEIVKTSGDLGGKY